MIDFLATAPHYRDHLSAVRDALPPAARGDIVPSLSGPDNPVLVAAYGDMVRARYAGRNRIALMEHGSGQSYGGRGIAHGSYAGGMGRSAVSLFLHPGEHPAARDRKMYPNSRVEVVGSPFLDNLPRREGGSGRVIAFSSHFNAPIVPEARSAWPWIFPTIARLNGQYEILGHAHPRMFDAAQKHYAKVGIEPVRDFAEVCRRADLYICDNSSTLFAFAATGRPVVVVNPPWYDRRVNHGLRFWEASEVGVNCNDPDTLGECIERAFEDAPEQQAKREAALDLVYAYRTGASQRAADVLMDWAA